MKIGIVVLVPLLVVQALLAAPKSSTEVSTETITSVEQADALVRATQEQFWQLFPPSDDWLYVHSDKSVKPVIWSSGWPNALKKQMYAEMRTVNGNLYPVYTLWAEADRVTGDLTYYNMFGQPVWTSLAPYGYTPLSPVLDRYDVESVEELSKSQQNFTASSIGLEFQLIPDGFQESYEQDIVLEQQMATLSAEPMMMSMSVPMPGDGTSTNSGGGGGSYQTTSVDYGDNLYLDQNLTLDSDGWLDIHNAEIGQEYEIYFTYNLQYIPFSTNTSSYYTAWPAKVGLIGQSDEVAYWSSPMINENGMHQGAGFFKAFSGEDSDGDGLSDIFELMMTKTDPNDPYDIDGTTLDGDVDQDGDGFSNREEYLGLGIGVYTHPRKEDSDWDYVNDDVDPWPMDRAGKADFDRDRMPDSLNGTSTSYPMLVADPDDDNDRFSDVDEATMGSNSKDPDSPGSTAYTDTDSDGLYDWEDPYPSNPDGDNDNIGDGYEKLVLGTSPTNPDSHTTGDIAAYNAVKDDADSDNRPQWKENNDLTNPIDGLDFKVSIF